MELWWSQELGRGAGEWWQRDEKAAGQDNSTSDSLDTDRIVHAIPLL